MEYSLDDSCLLTVKMSSLYGCPTEYTSGLSGGWVFLLLLFVASLVYLVGGVAYKKATLGTSGASPTVVGVASPCCASKCGEPCA